MQSHFLKALLSRKPPKKLLRGIPSRRVGGENPLRRFGRQILLYRLYVYAVPRCTKTRALAILVFLCTEADRGNNIVTELCTYRERPANPHFRLIRRWRPVR